MAYTWKDQLKVCESIRRKCFESEEVDPSWLKKSIIQKAKERHNGDFAAVNEAFFTSAFKRAANEWSLERDLELSKKKNVKQSQVLGDNMLEETLSEVASPDQAVENKTFEETLSGAMDPTDSKAAVSIFEVRVILISAVEFFLFGMDRKAKQALY